MGRKAKIPLVELKRLLDEGKTPKECQEHFGVTAGAISNAKRKLKIGNTRNTMMENAHRAVQESNINVEGQMAKVFRDANELLDICMAWARGDNVAIQVMESQVRKVRVGRGEDAEEVSEYKFKDPRDIALRAMAEIRQSVKLLADIRQMLFDQEAAAEFQQIVIEAIGSVDPETRDKIVRELQSRQALRAAIQLDPPKPDGE